MKIRTSPGEVRRVNGPFKSLDDDDWLGLEARMSPEIPATGTEYMLYFPAVDDSRNLSAIRWGIGTSRHSGQSLAGYFCAAHWATPSTGEAKRQRNTKQYEYRASLDQLPAA